MKYFIKQLLTVILIVNLFSSCETEDRSIKFSIDGKWTGFMVRKNINNKEVTMDSLQNFEWSFEQGTLFIQQGMPTLLGREISRDTFNYEILNNSSKLKLVKPLHQGLENFNLNYEITYDIFELNEISLVLNTNGNFINSEGEMINSNKTYYLAKK